MSDLKADPSRNNQGRNSKMFIFFPLPLKPDFRLTQEAAPMGFSRSPRVSGQGPLKTQSRLSSGNQLLCRVPRVFQWLGLDPPSITVGAPYAGLYQSLSALEILQQAVQTPEPY